VRSKQVQLFHVTIQTGIYFLIGKGPFTTNVNLEDHHTAIHVPVLKVGYTWKIQRHSKLTGYLLMKESVQVRMNQNVRKEVRL
jgi:hypothetical protein